MKKGYIKLYRKIRESDLYGKKRKFSGSEAWIDLLLRANHKPNKIAVGLRTIQIEKGGILTSQKQLAKDWRWSRASVKRFLNQLSEKHQISYKVDTKFTLIFILNWNRYQGKVAIKKTEKWTSNGHQTFQNDAKNEHQNLNLKQQEENQKVDTKWTSNHQKMATNKNVLYKNEEEIGKTRKLPSGVSAKQIFSLIFSYKKKISKKIGSPFEINKLAGYSLISCLLNRKENPWDLEKIKELLDWYPTTEKSKRFGYSLTSALSAHSLNLFNQEKKNSSWKY